MSHNEKKISVSVSNYNFKTKSETEKLAKKLVFTPTKLDLSEITDLINNGYVLTHIFQPDFELKPFSTYEKSVENFVHAQFVTIDIDGIEEYNTLSSLLSSIDLTPSLAYTTLSHQTTTEEGIYKGNRYRLIYVFDNLIQSAGQYKLLYDCIINYLSSKIENLVCDSHMRNPSQMAYGSTSDNRDNKEVYNNNVIYSFTDFINFKPVYQSARTKKEKQYVNSFEKLDEALYTVKDENFIKDFGSKLGNETLVSKYSDKYIVHEHTPLPEVDENQKFIFLPENYIEIRREDERVYNKATKKWKKTGNVRKYRNGEGRKTKLFINALIRRYMLPSITLDHLLYCLMYELDNYYINIPGNDYITRDKVMNIAKNAFLIDFKGENVANWFKKNNKNKRKYIVNKEYATKNDTTVQYLTNTGKKEKNDNIVAKYFDINLSIKENLKVLKENGYTYGKDKLYIYRNELKGIQPKPRTKKVKETKIEVEDVVFGGETTQEFKQFIEEHTNKHISAPCAPTTTKTNEIINDVKPVKLNKMENEEILVKEYSKISKEVIKQTENYRKKDILIIVDSIKDFEYKFNKILDKEDLDDLFESLEVNCLNIIKERIEDHYRRKIGEFIDKQIVLDYYVPNVTPEYKDEITDLIESLHSKHINN